MSRRSPEGPYLFKFKFVVAFVSFAMEKHYPQWRSNTHEEREMRA